MTIGEAIDQLSILPKEWKVFIWSDSEEYFEGWANVGDDRGRNSRLKETI